MIKVIRNYTRHVLKRLRSFYHFGHFNAFVHGPISIGLKKNVKIGQRCSVNRGVIIQGHTSIVVGDDVVLSPNVMILDAGLDFLALVDRGVRVHSGEGIVIGARCWLGAGAIVLPGVKLGNNVLVAAGSVVTRSFESNVVIAGNPARIIRSIASDSSLGAV